MPTPRPFLAMLLNAYEQGGEHVPLVVVLSPSDDDHPVLVEQSSAHLTHPKRAVRDDDPTEPNRHRHPLSSSDEPRRAKNAIALYVDGPRNVHSLREHTGAGLRFLAPRSDTFDTDEDLSLTDVRASVLPVVVGVSASIEAGGPEPADDPVDASSSVDVLASSHLALADVDLPTWRLPTGTVVLDDALLRVLSREVPRSAPQHVRHQESLTWNEDVTDPLLCLTFSSDEDLAPLGEIRASPLAHDDADAVEIARSLFRSAVAALATGERMHAKNLLRLATLHDPRDALLACALSTLEGATVRVVDD
jgi:hypothetical protein